jgi:outer membrane receptor protein involved in Fe transport
VGTYVDEVPYGPSTTLGGAAQLSLDSSLFDVDRIEVLRGPQGTLYGASTLGGLMKYVTKRPDPSGLGGDVQIGVSQTEDGGTNYNIAGAVNAPISDKAAVRLSAFQTRDAGYFDNVARGKKDANQGDISGGRADLLWKPSDALSIRLTAYQQTIDSDGEGTADYTLAGEPLYGSLGQSRPYAEPVHNQFRLGSATIEYDFGPATLTSVTSYQTLRVHNVWDASAVYVPLLNFFFGPTYSAVGVDNVNSTDKFTQELRVASNTGDHAIDWLVGAFYTDEDTGNNQFFLLMDLAGNPAQNDLFTYINPSSYKEYAAFGDMTWHATAKLDLTAGLRYAHNDQESAQNGSGAFIPPGNPRSSSSEDVPTYLANVRYRISDQQNVYARLATGYRPGGPNYPTLDETTGQPTAQPPFESDHLKSYEVGWKGEALDHRFGFDASAYYIDWSNLQVTTIVGGFAAITNASGGATSYGSELTLSVRPMEDFTATGAFAYQHATMNEADPFLGAAKGERLPNTPEFSASISADYRISALRVAPTIGATVRYVDDRTVSFENSGSFPQYHLPAYTMFDLRGSVPIGKVDLQLYVHNVGNERAELGNLFPSIGTRIAIAQPRTIGLTATAHF